MLERLFAPRWDFFLAEQRKESFFPGKKNIFLLCLYSFDEKRLIIIYLLLLLFLLLFLGVFDVYRRAWEASEERN